MYDVITLCYQTLGQNSLWVARLLISLVEFQSRNILRAAALAEIVLFPVVLIMALFGHCGLMSPFVYYYFVTWRYASRRNPYTRNTFRELRVAADGLTQRPWVPAALASALRSAIDIVCRMAPPVEQQQQLVPKCALLRIVPVLAMHCHNTSNLLLQH